MQRSDNMSLASALRAPASMLAPLARVIVDRVVKSTKSDNDRGDVQTKIAWGPRYMGNDLGTGVRTCGALLP